MDVSICLAVYNGSDFLHSCLRSIISQMDRNDELIIVDDCSKDSSEEIIKSFLPDTRLKFFKNDFNLGVNSTFEKAIGLTTKEVIFLADQDDIWIKGRKDLMLTSLDNQISCNVVASNYTLFGNVDPSFVKRISRDSFRTNNYRSKMECTLRIILGNSNYLGCCLCFTKDLKSHILPFPKKVGSHDLWIVLNGIFHGNVLHLNASTLFRRVHSSNASLKNFSFWSKIYSRLERLNQIINIKLSKINK